MLVFLNGGRLRQPINKYAQSPRPPVGLGADFVPGIKTRLYPTWYSHLASGSDSSPCGQASGGLTSFHALFSYAGHGRTYRQGTRSEVI